MMEIFTIALSPFLVMVDVILIDSDSTIITLSNPESINVSSLIVNVTGRPQSFFFVMIVGGVRSAFLDYEKQDLQKKYWNGDLVTPYLLI